MPNYSNTMNLELSSEFFREAMLRTMCEELEALGNRHRVHIRAKYSVNDSSLDNYGSITCTMIGPGVYAGIWVTIGGMVHVKTRILVNGECINKKWQHALEDPRSLDSVFEWAQNCLVTLPMKVRKAVLDERAGVNTRRRGNSISNE